MMGDDEQTVCCRLETIIFLLPPVTATACREKAGRARVPRQPPPVHPLRRQTRWARGREGDRERGRQRPTNHPAHGPSTLTLNARLPPSSVSSRRS